MMKVSVILHSGSSYNDGCVSIRYAYWKFYNIFCVLFSSRNARFGINPGLKTVGES